MMEKQLLKARKIDHQISDDLGRVFPRGVLGQMSDSSSTWNGGWRKSKPGTEATIRAASLSASPSSPSFGRQSLKERLEILSHWEH